MFELVNSWGGHEGPYHSLADAIVAAKRKLGGLSVVYKHDSIYIVPRDNRVLDCRNAVARIDWGVTNDVDWTTRQVDCGV